MKCVCGYEYEYEYDDKTWHRKATVGDEPFIDIVGTFMKKREDDSVFPVHLYVCPKCRTVRMEE